MAHRTALAHVLAATVALMTGVGGCMDESADMDAEGLTHAFSVSGGQPAAVGASVLVIGDGEHWKPAEGPAGEDAFAENGALRVVERIGGRWRETAFLTHATNPDIAGPLNTGVTVERDRIIATADLNNLVIFEKRGTDWVTADTLEVESEICQARFLELRGDTLVADACFEGDLIVHQTAGSGWVRRDGVPLLREPMTSSVFDLSFDGQTLVIGTAGAPNELRFLALEGESFVETDRIGLPQSLNPRVIEVSGDRLVLGATTDGRGEVYTYERVGGHWTQATQVLPMIPGSSFGVGQIALADSWLLVGSPGDSSLVAGVGSSTPPSATAEDVGAARVYEEVEGEWEQRYVLRSAAPRSEANFGSFVSLEGNQAIVGDIDGNLDIWELVGDSIDAEE